MARCDRKSSFIWCDTVGDTYACPTCRGWDDMEPKGAHGRTKTATNWLRRNAEKERKARAALIEAHNAILQIGSTMIE